KGPATTACVAAVAVFELAESPAAFVERLRKKYVVPGARPLAWKLVTLAPTVTETTFCVKPASVARSILKPVSSPLLSVQLTLIWLVETAAATRFDGAAGGVGVAPVSRTSTQSAPPPCAPGVVKDRLPALVKGPPATAWYVPLAGSNQRAVTV